MTSEFLIKKRLFKRTQHDSIMAVFIAEFQSVFLSDKPTWEEIKPIFDWLKNEAKCARYFADINAIDRCRRFTESHFLRSTPVKKKVWKESKTVNHELLNRFEELRTIKKSTKGKLSLFEGESERERIIPPH